MIVKNYVIKWLRTSRADNYEDRHTKIGEKQSQLQWHSTLILNGTVLSSSEMSSLSPRSIGTSPPQAAFLPHALLTGFGGSTNPGSNRKGVSSTGSINPGQSRTFHKPCEMALVSLVQTETRVICGVSGQLFWQVTTVLRDGATPKVVGELEELSGCICCYCSEGVWGQQLWPAALGRSRSPRRPLRYHLTTFPLGQFSQFKMLLLNSSIRNFTLMRHCKKITFPALVWLKLGNTSQQQ